MLIDCYLSTYEQLESLRRIREILREEIELENCRATNIPSLTGCGCLGIANAKDEWALQWQKLSEEEYQLRRSLGILR